MRSIHHQNIFLLGTTNPGSESSLDPCGLRFLLAARHNAYLMRCLPMAQRLSLQKTGIISAHLAWAFHSESQEELLQLLPTFTKGIEQRNDILLLVMPASLLITYFISYTTFCSVTDLLPI